MATPNTGYRNDSGALDLYSNKFDFYSGSQITIWFGNIMIDDIFSIQWYRSQNKLPLYGYASQMFDTVAKGIVTIQGNFTINFRQRGYIPAVIENIRDLYKEFNPNEANSKHPFDPRTWPEVKKLIGLHLRNGTFGPNTAAEIKELGNSETFFEQAKLYEEVIWGNVGLVDEAGTQAYAAADIKQSVDMPDGFNIFITYGNPAQTEVKSLADNMQSTTKALNGVHLVGEAQLIQVGGQAIQEQYSFIARSTDDYIGTTR